MFGSIFEIRLACIQDIKLFRRKKSYLFFSKTWNLNRLFQKKKYCPHLKTCIWMCTFSVVLVKKKKFMHFCVYRWSLFFVIVVLKRTTWCLWTQRQGWVFSTDWRFCDICAFSDHSLSLCVSVSVDDRIHVSLCRRWCWWSVLRRRSR